MQPVRPRLAYLLVLLAVALLSGPLLYFGGWAKQVAACRALDQDGAYRAYCTHPLFGSYEHEAYGLGTEPGAVRAAQQAQVLIFGNSRMMYGFSTPQVDSFFRARATPYHLLGFGYGESSAFPKYLLRRDTPAPRVVIINADPFFQDIRSPAADEMFKGGRLKILDAAMKKLLGATNGLICRTTSLCTGTAGSTYRDTQTGQWIWQDVLVPRGTSLEEITAARTNTWSAASLPGWVQEAEIFLALLPVPRSCVILTGVPNPQVDAEGMAAALAGRLGVHVVAPRLAGLTTSDISHLSDASAGRWSAAFLAEAAPVIDACLAGRAPS